jgi:hypothetical protein
MRILISRIRFHRFQLLTFLVLLFLTLPFAFRETAWSEWANPYWFLVEQTNQVRRFGFPTFFLHSDVSGTAYPNHVFYAGFTIAVMSYLAAIFTPWVIFVFSIFVGFSVSWMGFYWVTVHFSKDKFISRSVAFVAITSPYFVTNIYGRGAWAEFLGCSFGIFLVGSLIVVPKIEDGPIKFLAPSFVGAIFLAGTHNISLLLTFLVGIPIVLVVMVSNRHLFWSVFVKRIFAVALGICVVSPFLLSNLIYGTQTLISSWNVIGTSASFDTLKVIFSPFLYFPEIQQEIHERIYGERTDVRLFAQTSLPLVICGGFLSLTALRKSMVWREALKHLTFLSCFGLVLVLMTHNNWWLNFPKLFQTIQFPYRLHPYLLLFAVIVFANATRIGCVSKKIAYAFSLICVIWSASIAVFQVLTASQTTPPGFSIASHEDIDSGLLPPVFKINTAPPIQFQLQPSTSWSPVSNQVLYFEKFGTLLPSYQVRFQATQSLRVGQVIPLVTIGSSGNATGIGLSRTPTGCQLVVDTWGRNLEIATLNSCIAMQSYYTLNIHLSRARYELIEGINKVLMAGTLVAPDGRLGWKSNLIGMSTMSKESIGKSIIRITELPPPEVKRGEYSTNVVNSPFVRIKGATSTEPNSSGKLTAVIVDPQPTWALKIVWPLWLGFSLSLLSVVIVAIYLLVVFRSRRALVKF